MSSVVWIRRYKLWLITVTIWFAAFSLFTILKFALFLPSRYFLRVTIVRRLSDLVKEYELIVHQLATYPDVNNSIKMEVGIEDCLHIEFEYNKSK